MAVRASDQGVGPARIHPRTAVWPKTGIIPSDHVVAAAAAAAAEVAPAREAQAAGGTFVVVATSSALTKLAVPGVKAAMIQAQDGHQQCNRSSRHRSGLPCLQCNRSLVRTGYRVTLHHLPGASQPPLSGGWVQVWEHQAWAPRVWEPQACPPAWEPPAWDMDQCMERLVEADPDNPYFMTEVAQNVSITRLVRLPIGRINLPVSVLQ
mmetsp:Transcript_75208/g.137307  ORF Transcript_75208/g.137307 Transcript_75208/m.137307 type:complete len:208 (+) Transcript_75208:499-1122(+)